MYLWCLCFICRQKLYFIVFSAAFVDIQGCHQYHFKLAQLKVIWKQLRFQWLLSRCSDFISIVFLASYFTQQFQLEIEEFSLASDVVIKCFSQVTKACENMPGSTNKSAAIVKHDRVEVGWILVRWNRSPISVADTSDGLTRYRNHFTCVWRQFIEASFERSSASWPRLLD